MTIEKLIDQFKNLTEDEMRSLARGHFKDFPKEYLLFQKRDMFGDSQFPHTLIPNNLDDVVNFLLNDYSHQGEFELIIKHYPNANILIAVVQYPGVGALVRGFLGYNPLPGVKFPYSLKVLNNHNKDFDGWSNVVIRNRVEDSRTDANLRVWIKQ